jgi:hypothetical protein
MVTLVIKYANGEVYFVQVFNTLQEAQDWLSLEQKRTYWKKDFIVEIVDKTQEIKDYETANELKIKKQLEDEKTAKDSLAAVDFKKIKTVDDVVKVLELFYQVIKE